MTRAPARRARSPSPAGLGGQGFLVSSVDLRAGGIGTGSVTGSVTTSQDWDANGRITARADPNGNVTGYAYDHQDRLIREVFADGSERRLVWNRVDTLALEVDPRGVVSEYTYDVLERRTARAISNLPPGVGQSTFAAWTYDGLGRTIQAEDDDSICEYYYDSLSREVEDLQRIATGAPRTSAAQSLNSPIQGSTERVFDGVGNLLVQVYPGSRRIERSYDGVDRLTHVVDATAGDQIVGKITHIGMGSRRRARTTGPGDVVASYAYDGDRRVTRLDAVRDSDDQRIRGFTYAWDREGHRRFERHLTVNTNPNETNGSGDYYAYDSLYRLVHVDQNASDSNLDLVANNALSVTAPTVVPANAFDYTFDAAGNRTQTTIAGVTLDYVKESGAPTFDAALNQYTQIVGATIQTRSHDLAGNVLSSAETGRQAFYDADSRLVQWTEGSKDIRYRYDAGSRRILKHDAGSSFAPILYFWDGWQCVVEATAAGAVTKEYVYGEGIDEVLKARLPDAADLDSDSNTSEKVDLYYHQNSLGSVVAVTDSAGDVVESYRYSPYGEVTVFDASGSPTSGNVTLVEQPFMFTGRRWDFEEGSGLYYYRLRYYDPAGGRFVQRDPLGMWGDPAQLGNGQSYCANDPVNRLDPMGLSDGAEPDPGNEPMPPESPEVKKCIDKANKTKRTRLRKARESVNRGEKTEEWFKQFKEWADREWTKQRRICRGQDPNTPLPLPPGIKPPGAGPGKYDEEFEKWEEEQEREPWQGDPDAWKGEGGKLSPARQREYERLEKANRALDWRRRALDIGYNGCKITVGGLTIYICGQVGGALLRLGAAGGGAAGGAAGGGAGGAGGSAAAAGGRALVGAGAGAAAAAGGCASGAEGGPSHGPQP